MDKKTAAIGLGVLVAGAAAIGGLIYWVSKELDFDPLGDDDDDLDLGPFNYQ